MRLSAIAGMLVLLAAARLRAAEWTRVDTPHFELYTDAGEKTAREALAHFEQVRTFFLQVAPVRPRDETPVRVLIFSNPEEFVPYAPNPRVIAFYVADERRDSIAMADGSAASFPVAIHEYTHLIMKRSGLRLPVWLNEGWAEIYSSLKPVRGGVAVGDLLPGRMQSLEAGQWMPLEELGAVTAESKIYNEIDRAGIFYAESWALAHMLFLSPEYKAGFARFTAELHGGATMAEALFRTYRRSPAQVFDDLKTYFSRRKLYGTLFRTELEKAEPAAVVRPAPPGEAKLALAELLSAGGHVAEAEKRLLELEAAEPGNAGVWEAVGYLEGRRGRTAEAREAFEKAFAKGSNDAKVCFTLAKLEQEARQPEAKVIDALDRAVRNRPDYVEAQVQLGLAQISVRHFPEALEALGGIRSVKPDQAVTVFSGLAYAALQTGDVARAREFAGKAQKWVQTPQQKAGFEELTRFIEARGKSALAPRTGEAVKRVEGTVTEMACAAGAAPRLRLQTATEVQELLLPEAGAIEFAHAGGGGLQLRCGPMKPFHAAVEYAVWPGALGIVRRIEF